MFTTQQIRRIAEQSGARDIEKVETDIILTHLLLRKDEQPDLDAMIKRVTESYRWLGQMTDLEMSIAQDAKRTLKDKAASLRVEAVKRAE